MRGWCLALALACVACQVGDPLVDEFEPADGDLRLRCLPPPPCRELFSVEAPSHAAEPVSLTQCTKFCQLGEQAGECPQESVSELPSSAMCRDLSFQPAQSELSLSEVEWLDVNLSLRAERPLRVVLSGGRLQHVFVELQGPITLRVERSEQFEDVRVQGGANSAGTPSLELANLEGSVFSVGSEAEAFAGELTLRALHLTDVDVRAASLSFEGLVIEQASLRADTLKLTDVTLRRTLLDSQKTTRISVFSAEDSLLQLCGDARVVEGGIRRSTIRGCADSKPKFYHCSFGTSSFDGFFELSEGSLENVQLGLNDPTRLVLYNTTVSNTQVCSHVEALQLGLGSQIKCSGCVGELNDLETQPACVFDESEEVFLSNFCAIWNDFATQPVCEAEVPPRPDRMR